VTAATVVLVCVTIAWQGARVLRGASAPFLGTDYPTEVAARMGKVARPGELLVSVLPWAYYLRTGISSWDANPATIDRFTRYVPNDSTMLVVADAAMRYHQEPLFLALRGLPSDKVVARFDVPLQYRYGYAGADFDEPVTLYRLSARDLSALAASVGASETPIPGATSPLPVR
jgi:hypothetical protein